MIKNGAYILKKDVTIIKDLNFTKGQEIVVAGNNLYINGLPLPFELQSLVRGWMSKNMKLFIDDTRNF